MYFGELKQRHLANVKRLHSAKHVVRLSAIRDSKRTLQRLAFAYFKINLLFKNLDTSGKSDDTMRQPIIDNPHYLDSNVVLVFHFRVLV